MEKNNIFLRNEQEPQEEGNLNKTRSRLMVLFAAFLALNQSHLDSKNPVVPEKQQGILTMPQMEAWKSSFRNMPASENESR